MGVLFYTVLAFLPTATDRSGLTIRGLAPQCSVMIHGFLCFHLKHHQQIGHHRDFPFLCSLDVRVQVLHMGFSCVLRYFT